MITSLLYIFLGLGVIILIYKIQYIRQEKKIKKDEEKEIETIKNIRNQRIYYSVDKNNINDIKFTSSYVPGRIILFDGTTPHAIRPQSSMAPKFRFSVSVFFNK